MSILDQFNAKINEVKKMRAHALDVREKLALVRSGAEDMMKVACASVPASALHVKEGFLHIAGEAKSLCTLVNKVKEMVNNFIHAPIRKREYEAISKEINPQLAGLTYVEQEEIPLDVLAKEIQFLKDGHKTLPRVIMYMSDLYKSAVTAQEREDIEQYVQDCWAELDELKAKKSEADKAAEAQAVFMGKEYRNEILNLQKRGKRLVHAIKASGYLDYGNPSEEEISACNYMDVSPTLDDMFKARGEAIEAIKVAKAIATDKAEKFKTTAQYRDEKKRIRTKRATHKVGRKS